MFIEVWQLLVTNILYLYNIVYIYIIVVRTDHIPAISIPPALVHTPQLLSIFITYKFYRSQLI